MEEQLEQMTPDAFTQMGEWYNSNLFKKTLIFIYLNIQWLKCI